MGVLAATGHESVLRILQKMKLFPGTNVEYGRTSCAVSPNAVWRLEVRSPDLIDDRGDQDGQDAELDAQALASLYLSADRRLRKWEDVALESFACDNEDHPATRRDESDITAVKLAAVRHELAVGSLLWLGDFFAMEGRWRSSDAVPQHLQGLIQIWYACGTDDQLNLGGINESYKELVRQIQSNIDSYSELDNVSTLDPSELGTPWRRPFDGTLIGGSR